MPYHIDWYIPQQVLYIKALGKITKEEIAQIDQGLIDFLSEGNQSIYIIGDVLDVTDFPNIVDIRQGTQYQQHPNFGKFLLVTNNNAIRFVAMIILKFVPHNYHLTLTIIEAIAFLKENHPELAWQQAIEGVLA